MTKLTELEKQKVITCVLYVKKSIECERYKLEAEYDKMSCYNEELEKKDIPRTRNGRVLLGTHT